MPTTVVPPPSSTRIYWAALLLSLPALLPLAGAIVVPYLHNMVPTGFIEYDMPFYMANARAQFSQGFHLLYGNPFAGYDTPAIYFQPQILLLGCMLQLGLGPAVAFDCFGLLTLVFA